MTDQNPTPAPDEAPVVFEGSLEELQALSATMNTAAARVEEVSHQVEDIAKRQAEQGEALTKGQADLLAFKDLFSKKYGPSGMKDVANEINQFVCNLYHTRHPMGTPTKAAAGFGKDYTTTTDATAGYLIDDVLAKEIFELSDVYGKIINRITNFTVAPGTTIKINRELAQITAGWRSSTGAAVDEGANIPAATGGTFAQISMEPFLIGTRFVTSNEMLETPGLGFGAYMARKAARAIIRKREESILKGTHGGSANDPPSDGLTQDSNITDLTDLSANTAAQHLAFIANCVAAYGPLEDTVDNVLLIPSAKYFGLAGETVNASNAAFIWANPRENIPTMLFGYELIHHNDMYDGTDYHIACGPLDTIVEILSGQLSIGFNPYGDGWDTNETSVRVFTHANYRTVSPAVWRRAQYA